MASRSRGVVGVLLVCVTTGCAVDRTQPETGATAAATDTTTTTTSVEASTSAAPTGTTGATAASATTTASPTTTLPGTTSTGATTGTQTQPGEQCDVRDQNCVDGYKCTLHDEGSGYWSESICLPAPRDGGTVGDPCEIAEGESVFSGLDNCGVGHVCFDFDYMTGKDGKCVEFCRQGDTCPNTNGGDALCLYGQGSGIPYICVATCNPLLQDCPDGRGCYGDPSLEDFLCVKPDPGENTGADGSPCEFTNACLPGLFCEEADLVEGCDPMLSSWCCTPFCSVSGGNGPCGPGEECVQFQFNPPPELADVGLCRLPA